MIKDKTGISAGALPSDTYAKLIDQAYAKYRVSPAYSAQKEVLFPVLDVGGEARVPSKGDSGKTLLWLKLVARGKEPYARIQVYMYRPEGVDTKHGSVWISTLFDEVKIHLLESELQQGAELLEQQVADIRRLLIDV